MFDSVASAPQANAPASTLRGEVRATLSLATPLVLANVLQMAIYAVDVMFVSRLGTVEFAAATLGVFMISLSLWGLIGLTSACAPLIAAEIGRKKHSVRDVRRSVRMALWLSALSSVPLMGVLAFGEDLLLMAGQQPIVAARAGAFLSVILWLLPAGVAAGVMRITVAALGAPRWALIINGISLLVAIIANYAFVFGHLGMPRMGLEGSALASVVTSYAMVGAYALLFSTNRQLRRYRLFGRWWRPEWQRMRDMVRIGVPIMLGWVMEGALFGGASLLMGRLGVVEVAAHAVALNIASITFQVPLGIAQAATIRVGLAYGARDRDAIGRAGWAALIAGCGFMAVNAVAIWLFPKLMIAAYIDTASPENLATVALALQLLVVAAIFQLLDGAQVVLAGSLRGLQDTRVPMAFAGFGYWVAGFGAAWWFGFHAGWGAVGVWAGLAVGLAVVTVLLLARWMGRVRFGLLPA